MPAEPTPPQDEAISDTSEPANTGQEAASDTDASLPVHSLANGAASPQTPDIILTPRQRRALRYLSRRRMRNARVMKRPSLAGSDPAPVASSETSGPGEDVLDTQDDSTTLDAPPAASVTITDSSESDDAALSTVDTTVPLIDLPADTPIVDADIAPQQPRRTVLPIEDDIPPMLPLYPRQMPPAGSSIPPMPPLPMRQDTSPAPPLADPAPPTPAGTRMELATIQPTTTTLGFSRYPAVPGHSQAYILAKRRKVLSYLTRKHLRRARAFDQHGRVRFWITIWSIVTALMLIFLSLGTIGSITAYNFYNDTQTKYGHQIDILRSLLPPDNLKIYDSKGLLLAQLSDQGLHTTVKLDQISPWLQKATVATEDKNFWTNEGIDLLRILRAALDDLENGRVVEGGSTITQQLIKNLVVGPQPTIIRKLQELVLTPLINSRYSKRDILEMYLNSIYYGHQAYGIDAAASAYFGLEDRPGQPASLQLDLAQAAMLAGIPSNPDQYDPLQHPDASYHRFVTVLSQMQIQGYITRLQAIDAIREEQSPHFFKTNVVMRDRAPHFVEFVLSQLEQQFHRKRSQLSRSGLLVYTTLDINLQDKIQKIAQQHIAELRDAHHLTNAAEVLIDFHTGAIISLLGSIDYNDASIDGQFDVATAYRQPGSSFKPYVYVTAFEQGISPAQAIDDQPISIPNPGGYPPVFSPTNYDLHFHGHMTLRCALQNSLNVPAVKVLEHVGISAAMHTAYEMGITSYEGTPGYSLVLGGLGIRLLDHTSAMGVFANGGVRVPYYAINKIVSATTGTVVFQHRRDPGKRVLSPQLAYMMTSVLSDNTSRIPEFFDCNVLQLYANSQQDCWNGDRGVVRPAAAKTGTTNDFRDNWTVGYTTDYVMGVWAGNDDNTPMIDVTGVQGAAPIWHDAMLVAEQGHPIRDFVNPGGLVRATVTYPDGVRTTDWFLPGSVPTFAPPTPTPTPPPTPTAIPSPTGTVPVTPTSTPQPTQPPVKTVAQAPYCPNNYSFAFAPPASDVQPPDNDGWW